MNPIEEMMRSMTTSPLATDDPMASNPPPRLLKRPIVQHRTPQGRWMPISPPTRMPNGVSKYRPQRDGLHKPRHASSTATRLMQKELERVEVERMQLAQADGLPSRKSLRRVLMPNLRNCHLSTTDYDPEGKLDFVCRVATTRHTACKRKLDCSIHLVGDKQNVRRSRLWDEIWSEYGEVFGIRGDGPPHAPHQASAQSTPLPSPTASPTPLLSLRSSGQLLSGVPPYQDSLQGTVFPSDLSLTPCPPLILAANATCHREDQVLGVLSPSPCSWEQDPNRMPQPWSVLPLVFHCPLELSAISPTTTSRFPPGFSNNGLLLTKPTVVHPLLRIPGIFQVPWTDALAQPAAGDARLSFPEEWMDIDRPLLPPVVPNYKRPLPAPSLGDMVVPAALQPVRAAVTGVLAARASGIHTKNGRNEPAVLRRPLPGPAFPLELPVARQARRGLGTTVARQEAAFLELTGRPHAPVCPKSLQQISTQYPPPTVLRESSNPRPGSWLLMRLVAIHLADPPVVKIVAGYLLLELYRISAMTEEERLLGFSCRGT